MAEDERGIDAAIRAAMQRGEFNDLPGKGKPIDLSTYFETPEDQRLAFSVLKNAEVLPAEVELLKEIEALLQQLRSSTDDGDRRRLQRTIEARRLKLNVMLEKGKYGRARRKP